MHTSCQKEPSPLTLLKKPTVLLMIAGLLFTLSACKTNQEHADTVLYGNIYTGSETAEAIAIKNGRIIFCGSRKDAKYYVDDQTVVEEYNQQQLIMPGFIDGHTHATAIIQANSYLINIPEESTAEECVAIIETYIREHPGKSFYIGRGWKNSAFENACPTADLLDVIDTDAPIYVLSSDGHSYWTNTAMIEHAGITKDTPDPEGGKIERYADGTPNGCFRDVAETLISNSVPKQTAEEKKEGILQTQQYYASLGYTTYLEVNANDANNPDYIAFIEAYEMLEKEDQLIMDVQGGFVVNNDENTFDEVENAIKLKESTAGGSFEITNVKTYMDGVVEGGTAYLSEPYETDHTYFGASRWPKEEDLEKLTQVIIKANEAGMSVHIHAVGDQGITDALDCFEKAYEIIGEKEIQCRNAIVHLQILNPDDYERFEKLRIVAVINPWCYKEPGYYQELEVMYLGEDRASKEYPIKSFQDAGVDLAFGTDFGAAYTVDPLDALHVLTTRMSPDEDPDTLLGGEQSIGLKDTISMMTSGTAYQLFRENDIGTLDIGMKANLIVLDQDILQLPTIEIENTTVLKTMVEGHWIYGE